MNTRIPRLEAGALLYRAPLLALGRQAFDRKRAHHGDHVAYAASAREVLYVTGSMTPSPADPLWKRIEEPELRALHLTAPGGAAGVLARLPRSCGPCAPPGTMCG